MLHVLPNWSDKRGACQWDERSGASRDPLTQRQAEHFAIVQTQARLDLPSRRVNHEAFWLLFLEKVTPCGELVQRLGSLRRAEAIRMCAAQCVGVSRRRVQTSLTGA